MVRIQKRKYRFTSFYVKAGDLFNVKVDAICTDFGYALRTYVCRSCGELFVFEPEGFRDTAENIIRQMEISCPTCQAHLGETLLAYPEYVYKNGQILKTNEQVICDPANTYIKELYDHIMKVLKKCKGRIWGPGGAAELLNVPPTTLSSKMKKLGIKKEFIK